MTAKAIVCDCIPRGAAHEPSAQLKGLADAGYRPVPMLPGADEQPGWIGADGRRVKFSPWFPNDAFDEMPADAECLPGIVPDGDVVAVRTFDGAEHHLPPTPFRFKAGDSTVSVYREADDLSAAFGLDLPPRSFGWRTDAGDLYVIVRAQAVSVPGDVVVVPAAGLPKLTAEALQEAHKAMGAPAVTYESFDPLAEVMAAEAAQRWAATKAEAWEELKRANLESKHIPRRPPRAPLVPHDIAERRAELEAAERAEKAAEFASFVAQIEADEAAAEQREAALGDMASRALAHAEFGETAEAVRIMTDPMWREYEDVHADTMEQVRELLAKAAVMASDSYPVTQGANVQPRPETAPTAPAADPYAGLYDCPGLIGDIVRHITATAMSPIPLHALGAALCIVGTAAGRRYRGPTKSSCVLYVANIGESGAGKEHALESAKAILRAAGLAEHVGPGEYDSGSAYLKTLKRKPLCLSAIDEFGSVWDGMNNPKSTAWMGKMNRAWKTQWGKNFGTLDTSVSMTSDAVEIVAPHWSVIGASTPAQFWQALRGAKVEDGSLNRMLVLQADRVESASRIPSDLPVPDRIVTLLKAVYGSQVMPHRNDISDLGTLVDVPFAEGAESYWLTMESGFKAKAKDPVVGLFFKRSAEMSLRIGTIRAIGINPLDPVVTVEDMEWGAWLVGLSAKAMVRNATDFIADTDHQAQLKDVRRIIKSAGGTISRSALVKKLDGKLKAFELDGVVKLLIEAGDVEEKMQAPGETKGRPCKTYVLTATA